MSAQISEFIRLLKKTPSLTPQQFKTLRGQAIHGDLLGAEKGYARLMTQRKVSGGKQKSGVAKPRPT